MESLARWVGITIQAILLGTLLVVALIELLVLAGADSVFHYQGF